MVVKIVGMERRQLSWQRGAGAMIVALFNFLMIAIV
jgi:hypothetical protein